MTGWSDGSGSPNTHSRQDGSRRKLQTRNTQTLRSTTRYVKPMELEEAARRALLSILRLYGDDKYVIIELRSLKIQADDGELDCANALRERGLHYIRCY